MTMGRPTKPLNVTREEKQKLAMLARRPKSSQAMAMRARIVLGCEEGLSNGTVAKKLHITGATVCKWRERFRMDRLEGLLDEPRPGAPRSITDTPVDGCQDQAVANSDRANLACVRTAAASSGEFQVLQRSAVRGKGAGYRRLVYNHPLGVAGAAPFAPLTNT